MLVLLDLPVQESVLRNTICVKAPFVNEMVAVGNLRQNVDGFLAVLMVVLEDWTSVRLFCEVPRFFDIGSALRDCERKRVLVLWRQHSVTQRQEILSLEPSCPFFAVPACLVNGKDDRNGCKDQDGKHAHLSEDRSHLECLKLR